MFRQKLRSRATAGPGQDAERPSHRPHRPITGLIETDIQRMLLTLR